MTGAATRRPAIIAAIVVAILIGAGTFLLTRGDRHAASSLAPSEARPALGLLTSLPLIFSERFSVEGGSPTLDALEKRFTVVPISITDAGELQDLRLLLMAHPLAQPAEALVDLDQWVRSGGRLLLLADPMLEWESDRPLGDPLRPPPAFADTGLLAHWGLRLDAPDERGPRHQPLDDFEVLTVSPGRLSGSCAIEATGLVARCQVGKGAVTVIADADFLNVANLDGPTSGNLPALVAELESLARR